MSVADRWHYSRVREGERCEHGMIPTKVHGEGDRWQVRWRDEDGVQKKQNFALRQGKDPEKHADAFNAKVKVSLDDGSYIDPSDAEGTFQPYADDWRKARTHDEVTGILVERQLRLHVYEDPATPGRTPTGGIALGHRKWRDLGKRPSLTQQWIAGMKLGPGSKLQVIRTVSSVFIAAIDDGLIGRNPTQAKSVRRPKAPVKQAVPWTAERVRAVAAGLPARFAVMPYLGAGTGMRQGEMLGLAVNDIVFLGRSPRITVCRQVRMVGTRLCFAPLKNDKVHDVPLPAALAPMLAEHLRLYPAAAITLPWETPDGEPVTFALIFSDGRGEGHQPEHLQQGRLEASPCCGRSDPAEEGGERQLGSGTGRRDARTAAYSRVGVAVPRSGHHGGGLMARGHRGDRVPLLRAHDARRGRARPERDGRVLRRTSGLCPACAPGSVTWQAAQVADL